MSAILELFLSAMLSWQMSTITKSVPKQCSQLSLPQYQLALMESIPETLSSAVIHTLTATVSTEGCADGCADGCALGSAVGFAVGLLVGRAVGTQPQVRPAPWPCYAQWSHAICALSPNASERSAYRLR